MLGSQTGLNTRENGALVVTGSAIDYVITGYVPVWRGVNGSNWTTANNWARSDTGAPITFLPGDTVVFDDSAGTTAGGTTNVTISGTGDVSPASVTFNNNAYNYTISGPFGIAGSGALSLNGTGSVTLSSSNTYSGGTNINAGTLIASNSSGVATGSGPVNINAGGLLIANNSGGTATGSGAVTINSGGTLQVGNGGATGTLGAAPLDNGVLAFSRSDSVVYASAISGTGSLVQNGPGLLTFTATNSYSGGTVINGGTLSISNGINLGMAPATVNPSSITINNATLQIAGTTGYNNSTLNADRGITLISAATINVPIMAGGTFAASDMATQYSGVISGNGNLTVTGGTGTNSGAAPYILELGGQNTYTGNTTVSNAIVCWENGVNGGTGPNNILPTTTVLNLINNGWFVLNNGVANFVSDRRGPDRRRDGCPGDDEPGSRGQPYDRPRGRPDIQLSRRHRRPDDLG